VENDAYWHHDSGWVFPQSVGRFVREGAAQDVAGSRDAVAHYVRTFDGVRVVVDVDVFPSDSGAEQATFDTARAALVTAVKGVEGQLAEDSLELGKGIEAMRVRFMPAGNGPAEALYFVVAGEWRVRIRAGIPAAAHEVAGELDAFAQGQRWDTLMPHLPSQAQ
jgi:hypothetical protein